MYNSIKGLALFAMLWSPLVFAVDNIDLSIRKAAHYIKTTDPKLGIGFSKSLREHFSKLNPTEECSEAISSAKKVENKLAHAVLLAEVETAGKGERALIDVEDSRIEKLKETLSFSELDEETIVEIGRSLYSEDVKEVALGAFRLAIELNPEGNAIGTVGELKISLFEMVRSMISACEENEDVSKVLNRKMELMERVDKRNNKTNLQKYVGKTYPPEINTIFDLYMILGDALDGDPRRSFRSPKEVNEEMMEEILLNYHPSKSRMFRRYKMEPPTILEKFFEAIDDLGRRLKEENQKN